MGFLRRMATKAMLKPVRATVSTASRAKLADHYNRLQEAYRLTDDFEERSEIFEVQELLLSEIRRRDEVDQDEG